MLPGYSLEVSMNTEDYKKKILEKLEPREVLEQLAEESAELSQAALKFIRAQGMSNNPTALTLQASFDALVEETADVIMMIDITIGLDRFVELNETYYKWERWARRLEGTDGKAD